MQRPYRITCFGLGLAIIVTAVVFGAGIGARRGLWNFPSGLRAAQSAVWRAAVALVLSLVGIRRGRTVVASVPEEGRIEAAVESRLHGLVDEVAIRARARDSGSIVDLRSRSRPGRLDHGVNAQRLRALLAEEWR